VSADYDTFGDPCPDTFKYLQVAYKCRKEFVHEENDFMPVWTEVIKASMSPDNSDNPLAPQIPVAKNRLNKEVVLRKPSEEFLAYLRKKEQQKLQQRYEQMFNINLRKLVLNVKRENDMKTIVNYFTTKLIILISLSSFITFLVILIVGMIFCNCKMIRVPSQDEDYIYQISSKGSSNDSDVTYVYSTASDYETAKYNYTSDYYHYIENNGDISPGVNPKSSEIVQQFLPNVIHTFPCWNKYSSNQQRISQIY